MENPALSNAEARLYAMTALQKTFLGDSIKTITVTTVHIDFFFFLVLFIFGNMISVCNNTLLGVPCKPHCLRFHVCNIVRNACVCVCVYLILAVPSGKLSWAA